MNRKEKRKMRVILGPRKFRAQQKKEENDKLEDKLIVVDRKKMFLVILGVAIAFVILYFAAKNL